MIQIERVPTGITALDPLFEGGFPKGRSILVTGEPGTGKTIFSLQFLVEGLAKELAILNAGTYLSSLPGTGKDRHIDVHKAIGDLAGFVNRLEAKRLVLDPAGPFVLIRDTTTRIQDQTRLLMKLLRTMMPTTNILTSYAVPRTGERAMHGVEEYLVAGAIVLEMIWKEGQLARSLVIEKMRCTDVKPAQYDFDIVKEQGIVFQPLP